MLLDAFAMYRREILYTVYILNIFVYFETRVDKSIDGWISVKEKKEKMGTHVCRGESSKSTTSNSIIPMLLVVAHRSLIRVCSIQ